MADLDMPIALRRPRRSTNVGAATQPDATLARGVPKTPRRDRKTVRFSDAGPVPSSGLTPMIRRTTIGTPRRRGAATAPLPGTGQPHPPPDRTAEGRVERRVRRGNVRALLHKLEQQKKRSAKAARAEMDHLRAEIKTRDREIYDLQNATVIVDTERIWDLEQQVANLRAELRQRRSPSYDWTLAARDPFASYDDDDDDDNDDDVMDMVPDEEHFGDATMAQLTASTPSRARSSFPTPPATSPTVPATPCPPSLMPTPRSHAGVQASLPDPAKERLDEELASLRLEVGKLTATLDSYRGLSQRIAERLSGVADKGSDEAHGGPPQPEALERRVEALARTMADRTAALALLSSSIAELGFPGANTGDMVASLTSAFRAARLELEYLTPGEIELPLTSHGAEVLDLLLARLRELAARAREDEAAIDEYHAIEQSLRKQLDARVSAMDGLRADLARAEQLVGAGDARARDLHVANDRLRGAVDGYVRDMSELERLVERMEQQAHDAAADRAALEARLADALEQTAGLRRELSEEHDGAARHVAALNQRHGAALALRDARVLELRGELDRVNEALRAAHETVRGLHVDKDGLAARAADERREAKAAVDAIKAELQRVLHMSQRFLDARGPGDGGAGEEGEAQGPPDTGSRPKPVVRPGRYLAAGLARRSSGKPAPRGRDSGMGLLTEDEVDI